MNGTTVGCWYEFGCQSVPAGYDAEFAAGMLLVAIAGAVALGCLGLALYRSGYCSRRPVELQVPPALTARGIFTLTASVSVSSVSAGGREAFMGQSV
jgi:hypothetical protein